MIVAEIISRLQSRHLKDFGVLVRSMARFHHVSLSALNRNAKNCFTDILIAFAAALGGAHALTSGAQQS